MPLVTRRHNQTSQVATDCSSAVLAKSGCFGDDGNQKSDANGQSHFVTMKSLCRRTVAIALGGLIVFPPGASIAQQDGLADLYTTRAIVTGSDERNRPLGFRLCFEDVLVKVSGDASVVSDVRFEALAANAGQYISTFSYRDRFEGKPVHDEQGTHNRPHFLTCQFEPQKIDNALKTLGRKSWLGPRPRLVMLLVVRGRKDSGVLSSDGPFDPDMREAVANAAARYGLTVILPRVASLQSRHFTFDSAAERLLRIAGASGGELPIVGRLIWSDAALGWIATWKLEANDRRYRWSVSGVNYDEAFRNAVRGAARVLSGNGKPNGKPP